MDKRQQLKDKIMAEAEFYCDMLDAVEEDEQGGVGLNYSATEENGIEIRIKASIE